MQAAFYTQVEKTDRKIGLLVSSINACIRQKDKKSFKALKELGDGVRGVGDIFSNPGHLLNTQSFQCCFYLLTLLLIKRSKGLSKKIHANTQYLLIVGETPTMAKVAKTITTNYQSIFT